MSGDGRGRDFLDERHDETRSEVVCEKWQDEDIQTKGDALGLGECLDSS